MHMLAEHALAPVTEAMRSIVGVDKPSGLAPDLLVGDETGWLPAARLIDGSRLTDLLEPARRRWQALPHANAALAWKSYSYWLMLPAVLGWAAIRRVPLVYPADVLSRFDGAGPLVTLGFRQSIAVAVLPSDPLVDAGAGPVRVVRDEAALLQALRESMLEAHLRPLMRAIQAQVRIGTRTLLGSVSSGIANGLLRASDVLPGPAVDEIEALLGVLGVEHLIELVPGDGGRPTARRKTCCLAFTLPRPKVCSGCCIVS